MLVIDENMPLLVKFGTSFVVLLEFHMEHFSFSLSWKNVHKF
jgi:hypothetical protein